MIIDLPDTFEDCKKAKESLENNYTSGVYYIKPFDSEEKALAFCDQDGWTVIQSRGQFGNPVDYFFRNWTEYVAGFGVPGIRIRQLAVLKC